MSSSQSAQLFVVAGPIKKKPELKGHKILRFRVGTLQFRVSRGSSTASSVRRSRRAAVVYEITPQGFPRIVTLYSNPTAELIHRLNETYSPA
jgi:hypothetical protein